MGSIRRWYYRLRYRPSRASMALSRQLAPPAPEIHHEWLPPTPQLVRAYKLAEVARDYGYGKVSRWELETWASVMAWRDQLNTRMNYLAWGPARLAYRDPGTGRLAWQTATPLGVTA